jgi:hypothetical protein
MSVDAATPTPSDHAVLRYLQRVDHEEPHPEGRLEELWRDAEPIQMPRVDGSPRRADDVVLVERGDRIVTVLANSSGASA